MKLYAPKYYKDFICIAERCRHSCCVGWEIDIDSDTVDKYNLVEGGYGEAVVNSIDNEGQPHFRLDSRERCPHLNEKGLCRIILELGEDYLCHICREHPRFYNKTPQGMEVGLGLSCEEACRIILSSDSYARMVEISELCGDEDGELLDTFAFRDRIYSILSDREISYGDRLAKICELGGISPELLSDTEAKKLLEGLEYLDEDHKKLFLKYSNGRIGSKKYETELERALAYFVYRHCAEAYSEEELTLSLAFCLFCERLLLSVATADGDIFEAARIISEEIEYSEDNTETVKNAFFVKLYHK